MPTPTVSLVAVAPLPPAATALSEASPSQTDAEPVPRSKVAFAVMAEPHSLHVGERLTLTMTLENGGNRSVAGLRVFSNGPWETYTIDQLPPDGHVEVNRLGATFSVPSVIAPGQAGQIQVTITPRESGQAHFTFTPNAAGGQPLPRLAGHSIVFDTEVTVTP